MPHFDSDHGESANIAKEIQRCKDNDIPFKAVRDGEVIIIE
jgi:dipeptidase E